MNKTTNNEKSRGYSQSFVNKSLHNNQSNNTTHLVTQHSSNSFRSQPVNENNDTDRLYSRTSKSFKEPKDSKTLKPSNNSNTTNVTTNRTNLNSKTQSKVVSKKFIDDEDWQRAREHKHTRTTSHHNTNNHNHNHNQRRNHSSSKRLSQAIKQGPISFENGKLSLVGCYVTEIDMLPEKISNSIKTLYLSNNSLTSLQNIQQFQFLTAISLTNNSIRYLFHLTSLSSLRCLERISLEGNVVAQMPYYREFLVGICPLLESVDSLPVSDDERNLSTINYRKCCVQLELLRCNELRVVILKHMHLLFSCHAEIISLVMGKFRFEIL